MPLRFFLDRNGGKEPKCTIRHVSLLNTDGFNPCGNIEIDSPAVLLIPRDIKVLLIPRDIKRVCPHTLHMMQHCVSCVRRVCTSSECSHEHQSMKHSFSRCIKYNRNRQKTERKP